MYGATGIGKSQWKIKTNKVDFSDLSSTATSYDTVGSPALTPNFMISQGEAASGSNLHLDLLNQIPTSAGILLQTGRTGNWNEIGSVVIGDKIQFSGPALTTKDMARVGHAVKMVLRVVDQFQEKLVAAKVRQ